MFRNDWTKVFRRRIEFPSPWRAALLCYATIAFLHPSPILAGHDVMVHLAIYNDGPFQTNQVPAVFGVPLPSSDDPVAPKDLILAGADTWQTRTLSHWPNGSVRWLMVEAIVSVEPNQDRAAFHLTTGQVQAKQPFIATELQDGFVLDSGVCRIRISRTDPVVIQPLSLEEMELEQGSIPLNQHPDLGTRLSRKVVLENNGPVTATVAVKETYDLQGAQFTFTRRCQLFKGQKGLTIESTLLRQDGGMKTIRTKFPILTSTTKGTGLIQVTQQGLSPSISEESFQVGPGSMRRMWHTINLQPQDVSSQTLRPFLGRAISIDTYNDASCTEAPVIAGTENISLNLRDPAFSRSKAAQLIRDIMSGKQLPTPSNYLALSEWMQHWTPEIETSPLNGSGNEEPSMDSLEFDDAWRIPSLWYFMTGETIFKEMRLNEVPRQPFEEYDVRQFHRLWDAYLLNDSLELRNAISTKLAGFFGNVSHLASNLKHRHFFRMVANLIHQGGLEQGEQDVWLDRMESLIHHDRNQLLELNDLLFAEGYRLTGESKYLKEGKQWLEQTFNEAPGHDAVSGLIRNIQRQHVWRWLEPTVTNLGAEGWRLTWKAPRDAVRYRFKHSNKKITNLPAKDNDVQTIPFHAAENLDLDISPASQGVLQTIVVDKIKTSGNSHFAMRYLERGPDLPPLKASRNNPIADSTPDASTSAAPEPIANLIWIGLVVGGLGMTFLFLKKFL